MIDREYSSLNKSYIKCIVKLIGLLGLRHHMII